MKTETTAWQPIETAPHNKKIIVYYKNGCDKGRTVFAVYIDKFTEEDTGDSDMDTDYSEERDCYYWPEGWYEQIDNWDDYSAVRFQYKPTHWMEMPHAPE